MVDFIKKTFNWFARIIIWIQGEKQSFTNIIFAFNISFLVLCFPLFFSSDVERAIRISGMLCQLCGLISVILDLYGVTKLFGITESVKRKLKQFPKFAEVSKPTNILASLGMLKCSMQGAHVEQKAFTIEEKLMALESRFNQEIKDVKNQIQQVDYNQKQKFKQEKQERIQADKENRELIKDVSANNVFWGVVGVVWLFVGIVLASMPTEISHFFK